MSAVSPYHQFTILKTVAQLVTHRVSLANSQMQAMSTLQLEQHACGGCGNGETGLFAEFNQKLLCTLCFKQEIESRVKAAS
jgi:hypothetical protein